MTEVKKVTLGEEIRAGIRLKKQKAAELAQKEEAKRDAIEKAEGEHIFRNIVNGDPTLEERIRDEAKKGGEYLQVLQASYSNQNRFTGAEQNALWLLEDWAQVNGLNYFHTNYERDYPETFTITWKP